MCKERYISSILPFILTLTALFAQAGGPSSQELYPLPDDPSKGWKIFIDRGCISCHSIRGEGGEIGPDLGRRAFNLSFIQIAGVMWNHLPLMRAKMEELNISQPVFTGEEMADLIAFLYYLNYFDDPGDATVGKRLFSDKGCAKCHSIRGEGGKAGPALDRMKRYAFPVFIAQSMWNHGPNMVTKMREVGEDISTFKGTEIIDLFAYIRSVGASSGRRRVYTSPGNARRGEDLFTSKGCITCHAVGGEESADGPNLAEVELHYSVTQIAGIMWNHWSQMWDRMEELGVPNPVFSGEEIADVIAYIYSIRYSGRTGDASKGKELLSSKGCIRCHTAAGEEGATGPNLSTSKVTQSYSGAAQAMWNHGSFMEMKMEEKQILWPRFEGNEMADLLEYLRVIHK